MKKRKFPLEVKHYLLVLKYLPFLLLVPLGCFSQISTDSLISEWKYAGSTILDNFQIQSSVKDFGAKGDGQADDSQAILSAISSLNGKSGIIFFPRGQYLIKESLILPDSCTLQGEGAKNSKLIFDLGGDNQSCIQASTSPKEDFSFLKQDLEKGDSILHLSSFHHFQVGDYVEILQNNGDWDIAPSAWSEMSLGQISRVVRVENDRVWLQEPARHRMDTVLSAKARKIHPKSHIGISCLGIERIDSAQNGYQIYLGYAANSWIQGVESNKSVGSHIMMDGCYKVSVCGNYFHDSFSYDGQSTRGYGVTLAHHSSLVRVENNVFQHLRHAMMVKQGANGNVFAYNYARETYRSEIPHDLSGDISLHGHYAFANLFEGNIVNNIIIDHFWGPSGPGNTFLRNRTLDYGISSFNFNLDSPTTTRQIFIGNEVATQDLPKGILLVDEEQNLLYANRVRGQIEPPMTHLLNDESYYLDHTPVFWAANLPWPSISSPQSPFFYSIPAKYRFEQLEDPTVCQCQTPSQGLEIEQEMPTSLSYNSNSVFNLLSAEIKASTLELNVEAHSSGTFSIRLWDIQGRMLLKHEAFHGSGKHRFQLPINQPTSSQILILSLQKEGNLIHRKLFVF